MATVRATRGASVDDLVAAALPRLDALLAQGVTTVEIKSGYGLTLDAERTMLRARSWARCAGPCRHHVPGRPCPATRMGGQCRWLYHGTGRHWLPTLAGEGLVDAVDAFCEGIAFSPRRSIGCSTQRVRWACPCGSMPNSFPIWAGGAGGRAWRALRRSSGTPGRSGRGGHGGGTVAMLLPGAFYFMRETVKPPIAACAPPACPWPSPPTATPAPPRSPLLLAMNMGATLFGLTVEECLLGATVHAARALGLAGTLGQLAPGQRRSGDLECRAPGRSCSRDGRRAAPCPHLEWKMSPVVLTPGAATLADWRAIHAGADVALHDAWGAIATSAAAVARPGQGRGGLWHQHRLRQAGERAHCR
jgi:imidazolonepropionase